MAWSSRGRPQTLICRHLEVRDAEEVRLLHLAIARCQLREYLALDDNPACRNHTDLMQLVDRLVLVLGYYRTMREGGSRAALRPVVAEAMFHLEACRHLLSDRKMLHLRES
jgi:hypothetical protein